jgi:hypothetical protein
MAKINGRGEMAIMAKVIVGAAKQHQRRNADRKWQNGGISVCSNDVKTWRWLAMKHQ